MLLKILGSLAMWPSRPWEDYTCPCNCKALWISCCWGMGFWLFSFYIHKKDILIAVENNIIYWLLVAFYHPFLVVKCEKKISFLIGYKSYVSVHADKCKRWSFCRSSWNKNSWCNADELCCTRLQTKVFGEFFVMRSNLVLYSRLMSENCLQIIDEIDGALGEGKGAVEVILKMVIHVCPFICQANTSIRL